MALLGDQRFERRVRVLAHPVMLGCGWVNVGCGHRALLSDAEAEVNAVPRQEADQQPQGEEQQADEPVENVVLVDHRSRRAVPPGRTPWLGRLTGLDALARGWQWRGDRRARVVDDRHGGGRSRSRDLLRAWLIGFLQPDRDAAVLAERLAAVVA